MTSKKTKKIKKWIWMPHAGHFIGGQNCKFKLNTCVGKYIVSTVGELLWDQGIREITAIVRKLNLEGRGDERLADYMRKIGYEDLHSGGWKYETMVFAAEKAPRGKGEDCCPYRILVSQLKDEKWYKTAGEALKGHYKLCEKWSKK